MDIAHRAKQTRHLSRDSKMWSGDSGAELYVENMSIALRCFVRLQGYRTVSSCGARPFPPLQRSHPHKLGVPFATMSTGARSKIRDTLLQDEALLVCQTCGMQYDHSNPANLTPPNACPVCEGNSRVSIWKRHL